MVVAVVVVMGVSGSGKSTVGRLLADRLQVAYADADDLHGPANVAKMAAGHALTDDDRWPWLEAVGTWLADHADSGGVMACSALRRSYRDVLRRHAPDLQLVYLEVTPDLVARRVAARADHFMPATLVESQLATLEPPGPDEDAVTIDASAPLDAILAAIPSAEVA